MQAIAILCKYMTKEIDIQLEKQNQGDWIKIFVPYPASEKMIAILQNENGETIKRVKLSSGNNAIDISQVIYSTILLKIDTAFETILKKIQINQL
jgi:hypothetical protein